MSEFDSALEEEAVIQEAPRVSRRFLTEQAVNLAMQSRWQEAAKYNRRIVETVPDDAEAWNRLGKAFTEMGQVPEARDAYEHCLQVDPANLIAQRNLDFLSRLSETEAAELTAKAGDKLDPRFFMEETGKTGITVLESVDGDVLATLTAGDRVRLHEEDGQLVVSTVSGARIGVVEERLAARLIRLMQTGNEYQAGVVGVDHGSVRIIMRETFQPAQNVGRISFPPRVSDTLPRPYLRESTARRGTATDDEDDDDLDIDTHDDAGDDDDDFTFHEGGSEDA